MGQDLTWFAIHFGFKIFLLPILDKLGVFLFPLLNKYFGSFLDLFPILFFIRFHPAKLNGRFYLFNNFQSVLWLVILRLNNRYFLTNLIDVYLFAHRHHLDHFLFLLEFLSLLD